MPGARGAAHPIDSDTTAQKVPPSPTGAVNYSLLHVMLSEVAGMCAQDLPQRPICKASDFYCPAMHTVSGLTPWPRDVAPPMWKEWPNVALEPLADSMQLLHFNAALWVIGQMSP